jgi:hypothetical protein
MTLHVVSIDALAYLIDALTTKQEGYMIVIKTDDYQSQLKADDRSFIVEVLDAENHYIEQWDLNQRTYTLEEAKSILNLSDDIIDEYKESYDTLKEK